MCSLQCGFAMEVDAGVPVRMDYDGDSPLARGSLCARGHYNLELLLHPKRFLAATINRRRVPWSTGVTKLGEKLTEIKNTHGGDAIGVILGTELSNEDYDTAAGFASGVLGTKNIGVAYDGNDYPFLMGGGTGDAVPEDLDDADCFVLVGDVFWGHPCVSKRIIEARHKSRAHHVVTINPYRSNTDWFADAHLQHSVGAEPLVLAGLLKAMNAQGVPSIDVARAAAAAGVAAADIEIVAKRLGQFKKIVVIVSSRFGESTSGYLTAMLASKLATVVHGKYAPLFRGGNAIGAFNRIGSAATAAEILKGVKDKKIKALLVFGPDIVQLYPGAVGAEDLEELEFLAAGAAFENDTTKHADVGLPQAVWTEYPGTYTPSFSFATSIEDVIAPQGDGRSVGGMLKDIAAEMGATIGTTASATIGTTASATIGTGGAAAHPELAIDAEQALAKMSPAAKGMTLVEGVNPLHRWDGTLTGRMSFPQTQDPYCEIWIGEELAAEQGVEQGASVLITTERGETQIIAIVTDRMSGGVVAIPSYVPDARGLMVWTLNPKTRWFDVIASGVKVTSEG
ncbi:molybdopterin-dependent oxidoreductase [bacterium]|nr:molybdopterin-dependent oxidoreductase [bacterium]